jgi:hypothetical protein
MSVAMLCNSHTTSSQGISALYEVKTLVLHYQTPNSTEHEHRQEFANEEVVGGNQKCL